MLDFHTYPVCRSWVSSNRLECLLKCLICVSQVHSGPQKIHVFMTQDWVTWLEPISARHIFGPLDLAPSKVSSWVLAYVFWGEIFALPKFSVLQFSDFKKLQIFVSKTNINIDWKCFGSISLILKFDLFLSNITLKHQFLLSIINVGFYFYMVVCKRSQEIRFFRDLFHCF